MGPEITINNPCKIQNCPKLKTEHSNNEAGEKEGTGMPGNTTASEERTQSMTETQKINRVLQLLDERTEVKQTIETTKKQDLPSPWTTTKDEEDQRSVHTDSTQEDCFHKRHSTKQR